MKKKTSLEEAMGNAGKNKEKLEKAILTSAASSSRVGKKLIAGHFEPEVHKQLKQLSVNEDTSIQDLLGEALNDLFKKHGVEA